jgi:hypothetical protein
VVSAALTAVTVTLPEGTVDDAVKSPLAETVPTVEFPPATPLTLQVTLVFELPLTVAVNCCVCETGTEAPVGDSVIETTGRTVTVAGADFVVSATLTAVTVTLPEGTAAGAV